jgi:hypothetical protein
MCRYEALSKEHDQLLKDHRALRHEHKILVKENQLLKRTTMRKRLEYFLLVKSVKKPSIKGMPKSFCIVDQSIFKSVLI